MQAQRILFVCTGNLCRSPLAQGLMTVHATRRGAAEAITVDSAGTHARAGFAPAPLAIEVAAGFGADISLQRSRPLQARDFLDFDLLVALDLGHLDHLRFVRPAAASARTRLLLAGMAGTGDAEVPDPYGGDLADFQYAAKLIEKGVLHLLDELLISARER